MTISWKIIPYSLIIITGAFTMYWKYYGIVGIVDQRDL